MELTLPPDLEAKLRHKAALQGRDSQALVREAIERLLDEDEWFRQAVEEGLAEAERGEFVDHEVIGKLIDARYAG